MNSETEKVYKKTEKFKLGFLIKPSQLRINIFAIIIITIGIILYFNPTPLYLKISLTIILIGCFLIIILSKTSIPKRINDSQTTKNIDTIKKSKLLLSEKIAVIITVWILFSFFITNNADLDIFFIIIFIGLLVIKQLTDEFTTLDLKKKINILIIVLLIAFIIIIAQKILTF